jgi:hypothetical protein
MSTDPVSDDGTWRCVCTYGNAAEATLCFSCGRTRPDLASPRENLAVFGWRLTLPNFDVVTLANREKYLIGRQSDDPIGPILQLYGTVSREHLWININDDGSNLTVSPVKDTVTRVFTSSPKGPPPKLTRAMTLTAVNPSLIMCLGQGCFMKIDRGNCNG